MPPAHRRDMVAVLFAAVLSSAYFVGLAILMRPIPSRSLAERVLALNPAVSVWTSPETQPAVQIEAPPRRPPRPHVVRHLPAIQLASVSEAASPDVIHAFSAAPQQERRRNVFVRFFHGFFRAPSPVTVKSDMP